MVDLSDKNVLILATDGFEQSELFKPREALLEAGATVTLASIDTQPIQGMQHDEKGETITPDMTLEAVEPGRYQMLLLPGGVANPDKMRMQPRAVDIVRQFVEAGKPIAAICHGPWLLVEADVVDGKRMTSWPSVRTDLRNAGADVVDEEVVVEGQFITSRKPGDIPAFNRAVIKVLTREMAET